VAAPLRRRRPAAAPPLALLAVLALAFAACAAPGLKPRKAAPSAPVAAVPGATPSPTPAPAYPQARPVDQTLPVKIRSRSLRYDKQAQETVFYGGVTATQDTTTLNSRELRSQTRGQSARASGGVVVRDETRHFLALAGEADYADSMREAALHDGVRVVSVDPYGLPVTVTGREGRYNDLSRWAEVDGDVLVLRGRLHATAVSATVGDGGSSLLLRQEVRAGMDFNRMQAERALFDQKDHSMDLEGDVRVRLIPSEVRRAADAPWSESVSAKEGP